MLYVESNDEVTVNDMLTNVLDNETQIGPNHVLYMGRIWEIMPLRLFVETNEIRMWNERRYPFGMRVTVAELEWDI